MAKKQDPISELNEWQEHQYNPGYWINRPPFFPPKRTHKTSLWASIDLFILLPMFFFVSGVHFFVEQQSSDIYLIVGLGTLSTLAVWRTLSLRPQNTAIPQTEIEEINRKNKKERKKKLPKRRKDYQ